MNAAQVGRALAGLFAIAGVAICVEAYKLGFFSFGVPAAGLFPFIAGALLVVASLAVAFLPPEAGMDRQDVPWRLPMLLMLGVIFYFALFERLGVYLATTLYLGGTLLLIHRRRLTTTVVTIAASLALIHLMFGLWLGTSLPRFPW